MTKVWLVKELELPDCNFSAVLKVFPSKESAERWAACVEDRFRENLCIEEYTVEEEDELGRGDEKVDLNWNRRVNE